MLPVSVSVHPYNHILRQYHLSGAKYELMKIVVSWHEIIVSWHEMMVSSHETIILCCNSTNAAISHCHYSHVMLPT